MKVNARQSKLNSSMKKIGLLGSLGLGLWVCLGSTMNIQAREAFEIDDYTVNIEVNEDGTYRIEETIDVDFDYPRHGLSISLQEEYDDVVFNVDGQTIRKDYTFPISDVTILSDQDYDIDSSNGWVDILFGSEYEYVEGPQTYSFAYTLNTRDLDLGGVQLFYQNIITPDWDTTIHHASFEIKLPKAVDENTIHFYTVGNEMEDYLQWEMEGNTIYGSTNAPFEYGHGITIFIQLPQGYFVYPSYNGIFGIIVSAGLTIVAFVLYLLFGKERSFITPVVSYKVPDGSTSAEAGYLLDGSLDGEDISSLVFEWAMKGYLTMEEKGETSMVLTKTNKDITDLKPYEQKLFNAIFVSDTVDVDNLSKNLYQTVNSVKESIMNQYKGKFSLRDGVSNVMLFVTLILAALPLAINMGNWFGFVLVENTLMLTAIFFMFVMMAVLVFYGLKIKSVRKAENMNKRDWTYGLILLLFAALGGLLLHATLIQGVFAGVATALILWVALHMERRSAYYNDQLDKIVGLYDYIKYAEADQINMVFKDNPYIYYDVLPYAYAFGLTQVWSDHFKDIEMPLPPYYSGHMTYWDWYYLHRMNHAFNHLSHPPVPVNHSSGRHGGSIGGFGGGGFSGGGFGGSHGGSW